MKFLPRPLKIGNYYSFFSPGEIDYRSYIEAALDTPFMLTVLAELTDRDIPWWNVFYKGAYYLTNPDNMGRNPKEGVVPLELTNEICLEYSEARREAVADPTCRERLEKHIKSHADVERLVRCGLLDLDAWFA